MATTRIHNKGQATIFENKYLEALSKSHPLVIFILYLPTIGYLFLHGVSGMGLTCGRAIVLFLGGLLFWSLFEYIAHRFLFHIQVKNDRVKRLSYILHGNHHDYPRDKMRIIMPPVPSLLLAGIIFGMMLLLMGHAAFAFFPGFLFGYLLYSGLHYAIHAMAPPFPWMKALWRNHHLHHYQDEQHGYGVSSLLWDRVFGTAFDLNKHKEDKEKVKELMY